MCIFNKFSRGQIFAQSLLGILLLTACSSPNSQSSTTSTPSASNPTAASDTLKLLYWQAPTILNPHLAQGSKDFEASRITYEPLASFDKDGKLVPFLAAEIPSLENGGVAKDGKSVTWKLKKEVKWSDGKPGQTHLNFDKVVQRNYQGGEVRYCARLVSKVPDGALYRLSDGETNNFSSIRACAIAQP
ncbi:hypothetical protein [Nostoc sp.]